MGSRTRRAGLVGLILGISLAVTIQQASAAGVAGGFVYATGRTITASWASDAASSR